MKKIVRGGRLLLLGVALAFGALAMANVRVEAPTDFRASRWLAEPPAPLASGRTVRIVTFNVADGYLFTTNRHERMRAIGALLTELDADLVGLQESFIASDRERLFEALAGSRLRHHVRFPGAVVGNGLLILSAWPIEEAWFHRFESDGSWYRVWEGDWWAGKGVGLARIRLPESEGGGLIDFYDTHAVAGRGNPTNEWIRLGQMAELARFVRESRAPNAPAFVVGDFNTRPGAPDYELAVREAGLVRTLAVPSEIDHVFAVESPTYAYRTVASRELRGRTRGSGPAFFVARAPTPSELWSLAFGAPEDTPLSDHPGYVTTVEIVPGAGPRRPGSAPDEG
jgi:sphingomyelin phosphodiesterase 2